MMMMRSEVCCATVHCSESKVQTSVNDPAKLLALVAEGAVREDLNQGNDRPQTPHCKGPQIPESVRSTRIAKNGNERFMYSYRVR